MKEISVQLRFISITLKQSIMHITYKKGLTIDLEVAKGIVKERLHFFDGKTYPVLLDGRHVKLLTREAIIYFGKSEAMRGVSALALLPGNYLAVVMAKFFITFCKPPVSTRIFKTREKALLWLRQFSEV